MVNYLWAFITSLVVMTGIDFAWLSFVAPAFYKKHIGFILAEKANLPAAIAFYVIFVVGVTMFVVYPGWTNHQSILTVALKGAAFGFVTYATYDLTNQATLKNWPLTVTIVDMLWGTFLVATVSAVAVAVLRAFVK